MIAQEYENKSLHNGTIIDWKIVAVRIIFSLIGVGLIAVGASIRVGAGVICVAALGVMLFLGWPRLVKIPHSNMARFGISVFLLIALGVANWGTVHQMVFVVALSIMLSFGAEMFRRDGRPYMTEQASATFVADLLCMAASMWLFVWKQPNGHSLTFLFAVVIAVAAIVESIETRISHILALMNALIAGFLMAWLLSLPIEVGLLSGMCVSIAYVAVIRARKNALNPTKAMLGEGSRAIIPHCILGAVAYIFALLFV